jgi:5'-3' exonuclease
MDKVLLIDGNFFIHRANTTFGPSVPHVRDGDACACGSPWHSEGFCYGQRYGSVFNFFRNLRPIIEQFTPDKCFFVLEGRPQFRYDLYSDYKANRIIKQASKTPEQHEKFLQASDDILRILKHFPITTARASQYEADDVIATLAEDMKSEKLTILSNDSDYIQLLQRGYKACQIYNPIKKVFMEAPAYPYVAWKSLRGDKSDNIPALLKPKKALACVNSPELFRKFLSVEENRANFSINRQLIEFRSVPLEEIDMQDGTRNFHVVKQEFINMAFQSIIKSWQHYTETFDCLRY